ncbi:MAG: hypothetical protein IJB97_02360 [Clostridia bacterium]|nr:hypothetical protein [Clostridia bacterium]
MKEMVFNFWQYCHFGERDMKQAVQDWKDGGFNVATSFVLDPEMNSQDMVDLLDECQANDIKLILYDNRVAYAQLYRLGEEEYRKVVKEVVEQVGKHPAAYAFFLGDEPAHWIMETAKQATKIVNELSPIPAFVNFNPVWRSKDFNALVGVDADEIESLYIPFVKESKMPWLAYDHYGAMVSRAEFKESGKNAYFYNLNKFYNMAKEAGVPLWTSLLCTKHWQYKLPTQDEMRWLASTAIAHGVQGIQWFMLYNGEKAWWESPIDEYNERQPSYYDLRRVNRQFRRKLGELIPKLELEEVLHYGHFYGDTRPWADGYYDYLKVFRMKYAGDAIISRFRHKETGKIWYMFVNASMTDGNVLTYEFYDEYKHKNGGGPLEAGCFWFVELDEAKENK